MLRKVAVGMAIVGLSTVDALSVLQKRDGAHAHDHAHAEPAAAYGAPAPAASYGAPAASYGAPAPAASYDEPEPSYGEPAPTYGAEEAALPDLTPIIIGILALVGLSLLFPTHVSVDAGRKKRSAAESKYLCKMSRLTTLQFITQFSFVSTQTSFFPLPNNTSLTSTDSMLIHIINAQKCTAAHERFTHR